MSDCGKKKLITGTLLFLIAFIWYRITLLPTVGYIDSPIFARKAFHLILGVGSTDHPLFMTIGRLFIMAPLGGDPAFRLNLVSAFFGALTISVLFFLSHDILSLVFRDKIKENKISFESKRFSNKKDLITPAAALAALAAISSHTLWWLSTETEVYTLNSFCTLLILWLAIRFAEGGHWRNLYLSSYIFGLGLANHQHPALFAPVVLIYIIVSTGRRFLDVVELFKIFAWFLLGFSFYSILVVFSMNSNGTYETVSQITGGEFRSVMGDLQGGVGKATARFIFFLIAQFYFFHSIIALGGIFRLGKRSARITWTIIGLSAINIVFILFYNIPDRVFFYLPVFLFFFIFLASGMEFVLMRAAVTSPVVYYLTLIILASPALYKPSIYAFNVKFADMLIERQIVQQSKPGKPEDEDLVPFVPRIPGRDDFAYYLNPDRHGNYSAEYYLKFLEALPEGAVVVDDWYHGYSIMKDYYQDVLGIRRDVFLLRWFEVYGGTPEERERRLEQIRNYLLDGTPVYLTGIEYPESTMLRRLTENPGIEISTKGPLFKLTVRKNNVDS